VKNPKNTRLFCRCVFKGVKDGIDFKRYLEIEADLQNGVDVSATEVQPIIVDCSKRFPQN
jgi:hypothetical protein